MGIKNWAFMLALHQPELTNVDPHDPFITAELATLVAIECKYNPWYFFREVMRVPPQGSSKSFPLRANRGNIALYWLFFNHIDPVLIQPRQTGKSLSVDALMTCMLLFTIENSRINMVTKDDQLRVANVDRLKDIRHYLPKYLQMLDPSDSDNKHEVTVNRNGNKYSTAVAQKSEPAANNVGRGLTAPILHCDEGPFIDFVDTTLPAIMTAGTAAREEAANYGGMYGSIFTTTAGKKDSRSGKYMYEMIHSGIVWSESLCDLPNEQALRMAVEKGTRPGCKPLVNVTMSYKQLGYTDEWAAKVIKENNLFGEKADRDLFNIWTSGGLSSPLSNALNAIIRNSKREPEWTEFSKEGYALRWYIPRDQLAERLATGTFLLGMDPSEAVGQDATTMVILDTSSLAVVAAGTINETNIIRFSGYIADLMIKYRNITLIPEARSTGRTLVDTLLLRLPAVGIDPFKRIYNTIVEDGPSGDSRNWEVVENVDVGRRNPDFYDRTKKHFGFATSGAGRHGRNALYSDTLTRAAQMAGSATHDKVLIDEITALVVKNGRIDHSSGNHDDMVVAWLLGIWMLTLSKNLQFYGITNALTRVIETTMDGQAIRPKDAYEEYQAERLAEAREQMAVLLEELNKCQDDILAYRYEVKLRMLDRQVVSETGAPSSLDALISEARAERTKRVRERIRNRHSPGFRMAA